MTGYPGPRRNGLAGRLVPSLVGLRHDLLGARRGPAELPAVRRRREGSPPPVAISVLPAPRLPTAAPHARGFPSHRCRSSVRRRSGVRDAACSRPRGRGRRRAAHPARRRRPPRPGFRPRGRPCGCGCVSRPSGAAAFGTVSWTIRTRWRRASSLGVACPPASPACQSRWRPAFTACRWRHGWRQAKVRRRSSGGSFRVRIRTA